MRSRPASSLSYAPGWQVWAALLIVYVVWGSTYLAIRVVVETMPPFVARGIRFGTAGFVLAGAAPSSRRRVPRCGSRAASWRARRSSGSCCCASATRCVSVGEITVPSGMAALVIGVVPLMVLLLRFLSGERVPLIALLGVGVGFCGLAVLAVPGGLDGSIDATGMLILVIASISWSIGSFLSRRVPLPRDPFVSTTYQLFAASVALFLAATVTGELSTPFQPSTASVVALLYLITFGSLIAYTAYTWLLQHAPLTRVATYAYVNPVVAVFLGRDHPQREDHTDHRGRRAADRRVGRVHDLGRERGTARPASGRGRAVGGDRKRNRAGLSCAGPGSRGGRPAAARVAGMSEPGDSPRRRLRGPRSRSLRPVRALVRRRDRGRRPERPGGDGNRHDRTCWTVCPDGAAAPLRRNGLPLLHQLRERQGTRSVGRSSCRRGHPLGPGASAGAHPGPRRADDRRRSPTSTTRAARAAARSRRGPRTRAVRSRAGPSSRRATPRPRRGSRARTCRGLRTGVAFGSSPIGSSSGSRASTGCTIAFATNGIRRIVVAPAPDAVRFVRASRAWVVRPRAVARLSVRRWSPDRRRRRRSLAERCRSDDRHDLRHVRQLRRGDPAALGDAGRSPSPRTWTWTTRPACPSRTSSSTRSRRGSGTCSCSDARVDGSEVKARVSDQTLIVPLPKTLQPYGEALVHTRVPGAAPALDGEPRLALVAGQRRRVGLPLDSVAERPTIRSTDPTTATRS